MEVIDSFRGSYSFLSNFYFSKTEYGGIIYPTAEHAYQAAKTSDISAKKIIQYLPKPGDAKRFGKHVSLRKGWEEIKVDVMREIVQSKFMNRELSQRLRLTGTARLAEGNYWGDTFWGVYKGTGENHLGRILMEIRENQCQTLTS